MKKAVVLVVLLVLISSILVYAAEEATSSCAGFFGTIKCFLWGDSSARAGMSWWDRGNVVGN